jgi:lincosamide nucleotidyltransferase A/C/D/E
VTAGHDMPAATVVELLDLLVEHGADPCVGGGWGIDALLGAQTRAHSDLDLWLTATDLEPLIAAVATRGLDRLFPWPGDRPWNFVLHDGHHLRVDLHLYEHAGGGRVHYGSAVAGHTFPEEALCGSGVVAGRPVRCEAPEWALRWRQGYPPRPVDRHDVPLLCTRYGLALPAGYCDASGDGR